MTTVRTAGRIAAWTSVALCILIVSVASVGLILGYRPVVITTGSMGDAAPPGSLIVARPQPAANIAVGDILVMQPSGQATVTHRIVEITRADATYLATTKGDANPTNDPAPYSLRTTELTERWTVPVLGTWLAALGNGVITLLLLLGVIGGLTLAALRTIWRSSAKPSTATAPLAKPSISRAKAPTKHRRKVAGVVVAATIAGTAGVSWAVYSATDSVGGNLFGANDCFEASVAAVHRGQAINGAVGTQSITIPAVDPTRSFVITTARTAGTNPTDALVQSVLASATSLELRRPTPTGTPAAVIVDWTVIEYGCGVTVQRGVSTGSAGSTATIPVSTAPLRASFVLASAAPTTTGQAFDGSQNIAVDLLDPNQLEIRTGASHSLASTSVAWQVVTFANAGDVTVERTSTTLVGTAPTPHPLPVTVNPSSTLAIVSTTMDSATAIAGDELLRASLDTDQLLLSRSSGSTPLEVRAQIVTFQEGTAVQHGIVDFAVGESVQSVTIDPNDPDRMSALTGTISPGSSGVGQAAATGTDASAGLATLTPTAPGLLQIERTNTSVAASFAWQVVEWGGPRWWDTNYGFRQRIDVATTDAAPNGYTVPVTFDHAALTAAGLALASGDDVRVVRWDGTTSTELDRVLDDQSAWDQPTTTFWIKTQDAISTNATASYWLYYGNSNSGLAPADPNQVWAIFENFESGTLGGFEDRTATSGWFAAEAWTRRIPLQIQAAAVTQDHQGVAIPIRVTNADLAANAQADGSDLRFTASDGTTLLDHELESWDAITGTLIAWVHLPTLSATVDTQLYLYYGNADAPTQARPTAVWDDSTTLAWHLTTSGSEVIDDSAARSADGQIFGTLTDVSGAIGRGVGFDGATQIEAEAQILTQPGLSASLWFQANEVTTRQTLILQPGTGNAAFSLHIDAATIVATITTGTGTYTASNPISASVWHHAALVHDQNQLELYINGLLVQTVAAPGDVAVDSSKALSVGAASDATDGFTGSIDEVQIASEHRDAPHWHAVRDSVTNPGFLVVGGVEAGSWFTPGPWSYRLPITIDGSLVTAAVNDYPLLVSFNDADLRAATQSTGADLVFTAADGITRLDHDLESYSSITGAVEAWVRIPQLIAGEDHTIFAYYGNSGTSSWEDPAAVFDAYLGAWHFDETS